MPTTTRPSNQQVRDFMTRRRTTGTPPPSPEQIRRELGWELTAASGSQASMDISVTEQE